MKFEELVNEEVKFYGVDNNSFCIEYDGKEVIFEAIEDESDGYRSYLGSVELKENTDKLIFSKYAIATVKITFEDNGIDELYKFIDVKDGHTWLEFGTYNLDDYYPGFAFTYSPKENLNV